MAEKVGSRYLSSDTCTLLLGFITLINEFIIVFWVSTLVRDYCCYDSYRLNQWYSVIDWSRQGCREKRRSPINNDPIFIESFCWRAKFNHSIGNAYLNYHDIYDLVCSLHLLYSILCIIEYHRDQVVNKTILIIPFLSFEICHISACNIILDAIFSLVIFCSVIQIII